MAYDCSQKARTQHSPESEQIKQLSMFFDRFQEKTEMECEENQFIFPLGSERN